MELPNSYRSGKIGGCGPNRFEKRNLFLVLPLSPIQRKSRKVTCNRLRSENSCVDWLYQIARFGENRVQNINKYPAAQNALVVDFPHVGPVPSNKVNMSSGSNPLASDNWRRRACDRAQNIGTCDCRTQVVHFLDAH